MCRYDSRGKSPPVGGAFSVRPARTATAAVLNCCPKMKLFVRATTVWHSIPLAITLLKRSKDFIRSSRLHFTCATANLIFTFRCSLVRMVIRPTGEADLMIKLAENSYGKSRVRLARVKRHADHNDFREWTIEISLQGDFDSCFVAGDNSKILPTDTMKNTVYSLARTSSAECMEEFAKELIAFLLARNPQVSVVCVSASEKAWEYLHAGGKLHSSTFVQSSCECQTTEVVATRNAIPSVHSGLENLVILKTTGSEFVGFLKDSLTTLPEATDRLFGTAVRARWKYSSPTVAFVSLRT